MTFEEAARWLCSVGGVTKALGKTERRGRVLVTATSCTRGTITGEGGYDASLTRGDARDAEFRRAFVEAVEALRALFEER